jgi:threonine dehydratase
MKFVGSMSPDWNISLFHYRNNGADYGRIVVGMQVPPHEMEQWQAFLDTLGYRYGMRIRIQRISYFWGSAITRCNVLQQSFEFDSSLLSKVSITQR